MSGSPKGSQVEHLSVSKCHNINNNIQLRQSYDESKLKKNSTSSSRKRTSTLLEMMHLPRKVITDCDAFVLDKQQQHKQLLTPSSAGGGRRWSVDDSLTLLKSQSDELKGGSIEDEEATGSRSVRISNLGSFQQQQQQQPQQQTATPLGEESSGGVCSSSKRKGSKAEMKRGRSASSSSDSQKFSSTSSMKDSREKISSVSTCSLSSTDSISPSSSLYSSPLPSPSSISLPIPLITTTTTKLPATTKRAENFELHPMLSIALIFMYVYLVAVLLRMPLARLSSGSSVLLDSTRLVSSSSTQQLGSQVKLIEWLMVFISLYMIGLLSFYLLPSSWRAVVKDLFQSVGQLVQPALKSS